MKRSMMTGAVVVAAFTMVSLTQAVTYTWTGTDNDWSNTVNWVGEALPAVTAAGFVTGDLDEIIIQSGGMMPFVNVPDMAHGNLGRSPKFTLEAGATLDMTWAPGATSWNGLTGAGTKATIGSGATLTYQMENYVNYASLARDPGNMLQTFSVNGGTLIFNHGGRLDLAFNEERLSVFNLDAGHVVFDHLYGSTTSAPYMEVWGCGKVTSTTATTHSLITLANGSSFGPARLRKTSWGSGNPVMVFDLQDAASVVTIGLGDAGYEGYDSLTEVTNDFGSVFISSTLGNAGLQAVQMGDLVTVSVIDSGNAPSPYEKWLSGYTLGAFTNQLDDAENEGLGDGLNNLMEYALGSAPDTVDVPSDVLPILQVDGAVLNYIYTRQNPQDTNLTYTVLDGTDLIVGLVNTNTSETVSGVVNGFETVTNQLSTAVEGQQFMKLKVELSE